MNLITALLYSELAARYPTNGSAFSYVLATVGELPAWIIGWSVLPFYGFTASGLARAFVLYLAGLLQKFGMVLPKCSYSIRVFGVEDCNPSSPLILLLICYISMKGTQASANFNTLFTTAKLVFLAFIVAIALYNFSPSNLSPMVPEDQGFYGVVKSTQLLFFAMIGFDFVSTISEEARNASKDVPVAMYLTVVLCTLANAIVAFAMTGMGMGKEVYTAPETAMAD